MQISLERNVSHLGHTPNIAEQHEQRAVHCLAMTNTPLRRIRRIRVQRNIARQRAVHCFAMTNAQIHSRLRIGRKAFLHIGNTAKVGLPRQLPYVAYPTLCNPTYFREQSATYGELAGHAPHDAPHVAQKATGK